MIKIFNILILIFFISCSSIRQNEQTLFYKEQNKLVFLYADLNAGCKIKLSISDISKNEQKIKVVDNCKNNPENLFVEELKENIFSVIWKENGEIKKTEFDFNQNKLKRGFDKNSGLAFMGNENGTVIVELYSDFQCHACKLLDEKFAEVITDFSNVKVIRHEFPLDGGCNKLLLYQKVIGQNLHDFACNSAALALCNKDKYWEIHDYLYQNQEKIGSELFIEIAEKFEITKDEMNKCFEEEGDIFNFLKNHINQSLQTHKEINRTPYYLINNKHYFGANSTKEELKKILIEAGGK